MERIATTPVEIETAAHAGAPWAFFRCDGTGYALRLDQIHEIVTPQPVTRLPGCGPAVAGLIGLRGRVITVFDLGVIAGGTPAMERPDHRVLIVRQAGRLVGLAVEELVTIAAGDDHAVATIPHDADGSATEQLVIGGRTFNILDPDAVVGPLLA